MNRNNIFIQAKNLYKKHFYLYSTALFAIWIAFFDPNSFLEQIKMRRQISHLNDEKIFYEKEIGKVKKQLEKIKDKPEEMKRLARKKYFFREEGEEIYLLDDGNVSR